ncbi:Ff.00g037600.m01.CDS01 [Fusarium sp. VM40]|nr:Ff.00g037600.m01.CDS01 [Fusarium sp. VM40]
MNVAGYFCSQTDKDDIEYRPLRAASPTSEHGGSSYTVCSSPRSRPSCSQIRKRRFGPWVAAFLGILLILLSFFLLTFVVERYAVYNFEASGLALADPVENYGDTSESAKRWVEVLSPQVSPVMVHSHNDYLRPRPLFSALSVGCASVEADVWLSSNGEDLLVGHHWWNLTPEKTLKSLYVDPLAQILDSFNSPQFVGDLDGHDQPLGVFANEPNKTLILFIDVKDDPAKTWPVVLKHLEPLRSKGYLSYHSKLPSKPSDDSFQSGPITVVGTGNIGKRRDVNVGPDLAKWEQYHDVFLDASLDLLPNPGFCQRNDSLCREVGENEFYTASVSLWRAIGTVIPYFSNSQKESMRNQVQLAKRLNLKSRYWELPGWPVSRRNYVWRTLAHEGVDLLNADDILKCDEAKPHCQVCISRGVQCGGYQRGLRWSTKHEKTTELIDHKFRTSPKQACITKKRRGRPPKRQPDLESTASFTTAGSVYSSNDANQGVFGEFMLENASPVAYQQNNNQLSELHTIPQINDFASEFSLDMPIEGLPVDEFQWADALNLTPTLEEFTNNTELALFPVHQNYSTLFVPSPMTDLPSQLVEYWFRDVCSLWSQYDSPSNANRMMATALWSTSEAVSTSLQSMSAAYLSSKMPDMKKTSISMMKNATDVIEAELRVVKSSPNLDTVPMGLIYGLFCLGTSICWLNATQLGIPFLKEAKALLHRINKQKRRLTEEERKLLSIFNKSWTYCEMLLSVVSDTNSYISYEAEEAEEIDDISMDEYPTAAPSEPILDDMPHPWTGVSNTVSRLLTRTLRLCRNYRYHVKHPGPFATRDHATALNMIEAAKLLEEKLLGLDFESAPANTETGDQKTPCRHLVNVAEAYRLAGLIHIYQTFPELVLLRLPDSISGPADAQIPWEECITPLSLRLTRLIEQLPADSGSKMTQPLLCITASTGLRFEPSETSPLSPESQAPLATPTPFDLGSTENCGLSDYIGQLIQADEDIDRLSNTTESRLKIVDARCFIVGRLDSLEMLLPPRPIVVAKTLVQAIWNAYDNEKPGGPSVHWIDVMEENNLRSLFG